LTIASVDAGTGCESLTRRASRILFREGHREADMPDEHLPPLQFYIHNIRPESTKVSCLIEVEIETGHYPTPPHKPRTKGVKYIGAVNPIIARHVDADLVVRAYCNGEQYRQTTEVEGDIDRVEYARKAALAYLGRHLCEELKRVAANLCEEASLHISTPADREKFITERLKQDEKAVRNRLPSAPNVMTQEEVSRFFSRALDALAEMRKEKLTFNRTNLAAKMYPENSNALQELRRQVARAGIGNPQRKGEFDDFLWMLSDLYSRRVGKSLFRVVGQHTLKWEDAALEE
jgi:hypothetical protein